MKYMRQAAARFLEIQARFHNESFVSRVFVDDFDAFHKLDPESNTFTLVTSSEV